MTIHPLDGSRTLLTSEELVTAFENALDANDMAELVMSLRATAADAIYSLRNYELQESILLARLQKAERHLPEALDDEQLPEDARPSPHYYGGAA
jgi:hypothetical protein